MGGPKWIVVVVCAAACGGGNLKIVDAGVDASVAQTADMADMADMSAPASGIGGPCTSTKDCVEGTTPVCFLNSLFNNGMKLKTPGGYCSSSCKTDADCAVNSVCVDEGTDGKWCYAGCTQSSDCRSGGYACFTTNHECFPNENLNCDPTAGDGTCATSQFAHGGCFRYAYGAGKTGECIQTCTVGPGTCPVMDGQARHCIVFSEIGHKDPSASTNDKFVGGVCEDVLHQNTTGQECLDPVLSKDYIDACADGDECYISPFFPNGDNLCHALCIQNGGGDGGVSCTGSTTCHDVWSLFGTATPYGLCL